MEKKQLTDGSMALQEKQCRVITIEATEKQQDIKLRVAAYARVSSASDDKLNSFAAQNRYYADLISGKENWSMVDIYADEGITGTSAEKREDFQRLLADCHRGLIDRILVKSIQQREVRFYFTCIILIYINGGTTRIIHAVQNNVLKYNAVDVISINAEICIYSFVQRYDCDLLFSIANYAVFDDVYSATESDGISILGGSNRGLQFLQR